MPPFSLPLNLEEAVAADDDEQRARWLHELPGVVEQLERHWSLRIGEPFQPGGRTAWVAPVSCDGRDDLVLKVGWPHAESTHEPDGLQLWNGRGSALLYDSLELDGTVALLLERCRPGGALAARPEPEQDEVIGALLPRLWVEPPADAPFRPLAEMCHQWADSFEAKLRARPSSLDPGLVREGVRLFRTLPSSAPRHVVLCTDLHAENVLAAEREPWLAIDPKPYVGDPTYDALQHMLNCEGRLLADPRGLVLRIAGLLGLDPDRLLAWLFARCVIESPDWHELAEVARRTLPTDA